MRAAIERPELLGKHLERERLAAALEATGEYKVARRHTASDSYGPAVGAAGRVVFLDLEPTSTAGTAKAFDLGLVQVAYDKETGALGEVCAAYSGLEDPREPLSDAITALTGLTSACVDGQLFDDERVMQVVGDADLIVAHHAAFDRPIAERRFPWMAEIPWACSMTEVDWAKDGFGSRKLELIALQQGFFYEAHRALNDAHALARVMAGKTLAGDGIFSCLVDSARWITWSIWAESAQPDNLAELRAIGFRQKTSPRTDQKTLCLETTDVRRAMARIKASAHSRSGRQLYVEEHVAMTRYSGRPAQGAWMSAHQVA